MLVQLSDKHPYFALNYKKEEGAISFGIYTFSPAIAQKILDRSSNNRPIATYKIKEYLHSMRTNSWLLAQPLIFDDKGNLIDGQHRMYSIIKSGLDVAFLVIEGLPSNVKAVIDQGKPRTSADLAKIMGLNIKPIHMQTVTAMFLSQGKESPKIPNPKKVEIYQEHSEAIDFAIKNTDKKSPLKAGRFLGAIAKAWYYEPEDRLIEFMNISNILIVRKDEDLPAANLTRDYLGASKKDRRGSGVEWFRRTERAIFEFCNKAKFEQYGDNRLCYPLPSFDDRNIPYNSARFVEKIH